MYIQYIFVWRNRKPSPIIGREKDPPAAGMRGNPLLMDHPTTPRIDSDTNFSTWSMELSNYLYMIDAEDLIRRPVEELISQEANEAAQHAFRQKRVMVLNLMLA